MLAAYWWNPFAWWSVRRLQSAEEECCDAAVLLFQPHQCQTYGEALLAVAEFVSTGRLPAPALSIGVERKNHLKRRMTMILDGPRWSRLSKSQLAAVIGCGVAIIGVSWKSAAAQVESATEVKPAAKVEPDKPSTVAPQPAVVPPKSAAPTRTSNRVRAPNPRQPMDKPAGKPLAFMDHTRLEPSPGDDETQRILKERFNAALRSVELYHWQYQVGTTTLGNVLAAGRILLDAKLALAKKPQEQVRIREQYLEFTTYCWKEAKAKLEIGGVTNFTPVDEAQAREARLDAELKLLQERPRWPPPTRNQICRPP